MIITVVLEALTGTFNTDIQRSAKQAERDLRRMEAESRKALGQFGKIIATAAVTAATGLAAMVKSAINSADELGQLSQKVGIAVDDLSKLAYAAKLSDVELGGLQQGLVRLSDAAIKAQDGTGETAEAFKALGISVKDSEGNLKSNYDLLLEISDAFAGLEDGTAKTAVAIDLLGRSGADLIPLLNGGAAAIREAGDELERFGGVVTEEVARSANQFNDNLDRMIETGKGLALQVASDLLPDLESLSGQFIDLIKDGDGVSDTASRITDTLRVLARVAVVVGNAFDIVGQSIGGTVAALVSAAQGEFGQALRILEEARAEGLKDWGDIKKAIEGAGEAATETGKKIQQATAPEGAKDTLLYDPEAAKRAAEQAKKAADEARRFQEAIAQGDAEIFQAQLDRERQALEASLDLRQISYKDYLAEKLRLTEDEINAEIAASEALLQGAERDEAAILQARIQTLEIQREIARESKTQDEARHARELADAYEDAARAAQSYVDEISRAGQRELLLLDLTPKERRFAQGQFQIDDRFIAEVERLNEAGLDQSVYDQQLQLLRNAHQQQSAEWTRFFGLIEAKQKDFSTSFNNAIQEYVDATSNVGAALGETFVHAIDDAIASTSRLAAEFILFGEGGKDAIYQIARQLSTTLLQALIQVGIQLLINKALLGAFGAGGGAGGPATGFSDGFRGFAIGGYTGDDPRNKIAGVVHGQEFVVNPEATRKNRGLLEAINSGTFSGDAASVPSSSAQGFKPSVNTRIINVPDKSYIKDYLMGDDGDEVFVNWVGRNGSRLRSVVAGA